MKICNIVALMPSLVLTACMQSGVRPVNWSLEPVSLYDSGHADGTEIISIQQSSLRAVLSNFDTGEVDLLDISRPRHLSRKARFGLGLDKGEELTSVAFHPSLDMFAGVVDAGNSRGRLELHSAATGALLSTVPVGYGPDAAVFSKDGGMLLIANEGEDFWFDPNKKEFFTPEGSISIIRLDKQGRIESNNTLSLADMTNHEGFIITQEGRYLEREIDWNGDGAISKKLDFDGNGKIENKKVRLGSFRGYDVFGNESTGERKILIPIHDCSPAVLEPEYIAISPDTAKAYVTLQENDGVAVVDLIRQQVVGYFGLGVTYHEADARYDGWVQFNKTMAGLREPDGITTVYNGRYFVTADEGDTDAGGRANSDRAISGGGRSVSVFDSETGHYIADTGNQIDALAFKHHVYPECRSNKKGSEPEMLVSFEIDGTPLVAVGLERAGAVELISLADVRHPRTVALGKIPGDELKSPEGIAYFEVAGEHFLLTANEMNGSVACFQIKRNPESD